MTNVGAHSWKVQASLDRSIWRATSVTSNCRQAVDVAGASR